MSLPGMLGHAWLLLYFTVRSTQLHTWYIVLHLTFHYALCSLLCSVSVLQGRVDSGPCGLCWHPVIYQPLPTSSTPITEHDNYWPAIIHHQRMQCMCACIKARFRQEQSQQLSCLTRNGNWKELISDMQIHIHKANHTQIVHWIQRWRMWRCSHRIWRQRPSLDTFEPWPRQFSQKCVREECRGSKFKQPF